MKTRLGEDKAVTEAEEGNVQAVLESGEAIAEYPDDTPYASRLVLGWAGPRPLHVVAA